MKSITAETPAQLKPKKRVAIGLLGSVLDRGKDISRWEQWRPTVSLFRHEDFLIDRFELIHDSQSRELSKIIIADIASISPETVVRPHHIPFANAWDFQEVYGALHDFAKSLVFNREEEEYFVHITT